MKILMLSPVFPMPLDLGSKIRIFNLLRGLSRGHDVTFVSLTDNRASREQLAAVRELCSKLFVVPGFKSRRQAVFRFMFSMKPYRVVKFQNKNFKHKIERILESESFDLIWVNMLNMLSYVPPTQKKSALLVCDQQNADVRVWQKYSLEGKVHTRAFAAMNLLKLRCFEKKVLKGVDLVVSVSDEDAGFMRSRLPESGSVWTVPNGVDTDYFCPGPDGEKESQNIIVFCGSLDITMNIDAAEGFARNIFPEVRHDVPDARFWIVGRNPDPRIRALSRMEAIEVFADVPDVRPYLQKAKVSVAPFRFGGGTKLKILEAMASGIPLISTRIGSQGIGATNWQDIVIVDDVRRFAERVVHVMRHRDIRQKLASNARRLALEKYSWHVICENLEQRLSDWADSRKNAPSSIK
ncbi:MAG: glycosyltransferase [Candidatus Aminicenantes bacterium]|nr:glycosyltransferase [Candidatus Aminicenantes bacterium]